MKSRLLLFATIFLSIAVYAQDVKVKKGYIIVDGKSVAKIERKDKVCIISDVNAQPLFTAMIINQTPQNNKSPQKWLQLIGNNGNIREVALEKKGGFTFSYKKHVAECLVLNNPSLFFDVINKAVANHFFETEDQSISTAEDRATKNTLLAHNAEDSIAQVNHLTLGNNGVISANNKKLGYLISSSKLGENNQVYEVLDINKTPIAILTFNKFEASVDGLEGTGISMKTYDNREFSLYEKYTSKKTQSDKLANRMVKKLFANGYMGDAKRVAVNKN